MNAGDLEDGEIHDDEDEQSEPTKPTESIIPEPNPPIIANQTKPTAIYILDSDEETNEVKKPKTVDQDRSTNKRKKHHESRYSSDSNSDSSTDSFTKELKNHKKLRKFKSNNRNINERAPESSDEETERKMELCKFYLMECCAKRDKCLYMHSDFPCKYYYLGIRCIQHEKNNCKFSHGKPLTDNLKQILLKHLETAPREILGDFPRFNREKALSMFEVQHNKLLMEYGLLKKPAPIVTTNTSKIPSLLDLKIDKPDTIIELENKQKMINKNRTGKSKWNSNFDQKNNTFNNSKVKSNSLLGLKFLTDILSSDQILKLEKMGCHTLNQINNLTVAQLNDLNMSIQQIQAIQMNTMKINKQSNNSNQSNDSNIVNEKNQLNNEQNDSNSLKIGEDKDLSIINIQNDIDMRIFPINVDVYNCSNDASSSSNDENDDEPSLRIDEDYENSEQNEGGGIKNVDSIKNDTEITQNSIYCSRDPRLQAKAMAEKLNFTN